MPKDEELIAIKATTEGARFVADLVKELQRLKVAIDELNKSSAKTPPQSFTFEKATNRYKNEAGKFVSRDVVNAAARERATSPEGLRTSQKTSALNLSVQRKDAAAAAKEAAQYEKDFNKLIAEEQRAATRERLKNLADQAKATAAANKAAREKAKEDAKAAKELDKQIAAQDKAETKRKADEDKKRLADKKAFNAHYDRLQKEKAAAQRAADAAQKAADRAAAKDAAQSLSDQLKASARNIAAKKKDAADAARLSRQQQQNALAAQRHAERIAAIGEAANASSFSLGDLAKKVLALTAAFAGFEAFKNFVQTGLEFNKTIEIVTLGIGSLISAQTTMTDSNGQLVEGIDKFRNAQMLATEQVQKLRIAGLATTATTQELTYVFQQAVGVGLRWGMTLDQIRTLSVRMAQAASALGMPMVQLNEEIRSLLSGTINMRNTRIAVALGITNAQIRTAQHAGTLFDTINKKLEAFAIAGETTAKSFAGVMSNIREAIETLAGDATKPLFETLRKSGQAALEQVFDLKQARISDKFRGILDVAHDTFTIMGDMLSEAITVALAGTQSLSDWMQQSHEELKRLLSVIQEIGVELGSILADTFSVVGAITQVSVETGVLRTILAGVGDVLASIHSFFQLILAGAALLGNVIIHTIVWPISQLLVLLGKAMRALGKEGMGKSVEEAGKAGLEWLGTLRKGLDDYSKELGDGGLAIDKYLNRLRAGQDVAEKAAAAQDKRGVRLQEIARTELASQEALDEALSKHTIKQAEFSKKADEIKLKSVRDQIKAQLEYFKMLAISDVKERERTISLVQELRKREEMLKRGIILKSNSEKPEDEVKDSAAKRLRGRQEEIKAWLKKELALVKASLGDQKMAYSEYYAAVRNLNQKAVGMEIWALEQYRKTLKDTGAIDKVNAEIAALKDKQEETTVEAVAAEKKSYQDLASDVIQIHVDMLKDQGHLTEAAALDVNDKFRVLIRQLEAEVRAKTEGAQASLDLVNKMFGITRAKTSLQELQIQAKDVTDELHLNLDRISVESEGHAISEHQAREKVADAYERARDALVSMLPALREQARLTGNKESINNVRELELTIDRMSLQIQQARDEWIKFRTTAREATHSAISNLIVGLGNMPFGREDPNIRSLEEQLSGARKEMEKLMAGPQTQQAQERITALRSEIQRTTVELENSKDAVTSWKDLFLDAVRSIVAALQRVAAEMLATAIIESTLKFFGGGGSVAPSAISGASTLSGGPLTGMHGASGGLVRGFGHDASDNIPAWLSPGEYVVRAASVRAVGRDLLEEINKQGSLSLRSHPRTSGFASGGLVTAGSGIAPGGFDATIGLEEGLVVRHLQTAEGTRAILSTIARNRKSVRSVLGPG